MPSFIKINEIEWNDDLDEILEICELNKQDIFNPNKTVLLKIKNNNNYLFNLLKENREDLVVKTNESNEILEGHEIYLANIILGYDTIAVENDQDIDEKSDEYDSDDPIFHLIVMVIQTNPMFFELGIINTIVPPSLFPEKDGKLSQFVFLFILLLILLPFLCPGLSFFFFFFFSFSFCKCYL